MGPRRLVPAAVLALALASIPARAGDPPSTKEQVLELYNRGKDLMDAGKFADACAAFEEAKRLDFSAINLILRLGDCYERLGRTASAYSQFQQAASLAAAAGDARKSTAEERARAVEPKLGHVVVHTPVGLVGLELKRNGGPLTEVERSITVDPGPQTIEATLPGKKPWKETRQVGPGETAEITVPPFDAPPPAPAPPPVETGSPRRAVGLAVGAVGLVGIGVGVAFGVKAMSSKSASNADGHCDTQSFCDDTGFQLRRDAQEAGTISTVTFILGGAALAGGAVLWLTTPSSSAAPHLPAKHAAVKPRIGLVALPGGLQVGGTF